VVIYNLDLVGVALSTHDFLFSSDSNQLV